MTNGIFDLGSAARLANAHPMLQTLMAEAKKEAGFTILDSQRGRAAQELAFKQHRTKVHYGNSAHNWTPAVALDVAPLPIDWNDLQPFIHLSKIILPIAKRLKIPIRWGGDWDMDGKSTDEKFVDMPHYELHPWRDFAKYSRPYEG